MRRDTQYIKPASNGAERPFSLGAHDDTSRRLPRQ
jgi:hypothetical protein